MGAVRFEGVDILDSLGQIMELHTQHYKDDFDLDKELIPKLALSGEPEDRRLLWLSRPCGTYTLREWEVYLEGSHANKVWEFYHEHTKDPVLAYALSIKDVQDGKVAGIFFRLSIYSFISPFVAWQERLSRSRFRITASSRSFSGRSVIDFGLPCTGTSSGYERHSGNGTASSYLLQ